MTWRAKWISYAYDPLDDIGVYRLRNRFDLPVRPATCFLKLSADNRYKLYVNGQMAAFGPQRGDARHWFYDTVDIAPFLQEGANEVVALIWNFGWMAPMAQHSVRTAFIVELESEPDFVGLTTPGEWEIARDTTRGFKMMFTGNEDDFYIDVGPGEIVYWRERELNWQKPHEICHGETRGDLGGGTPWMLIPRSIPPMRYERRALAPMVRHGFIGDEPAPEHLLEKLVLAPNTPVLLDHQELLCAYPRLQMTGPEGTTVTLTYSESMWLPDGSKGNRFAVEGKQMRGYQDKFVLGSGEPFEPLWWRTYRFLQIEADRPCTLEKLDAYETGYPLVVESSFTAHAVGVVSLWGISVRTAKLCAGETYFDCPYYEQLQYVGDTRIQALIGYYLGRDRALQRNAVETLRWSLMENGLTQSRYPSRQTQVIPPFSLWWIAMLADQRLYDSVVPDPAQAGQIQRVLTAFDRLRDTPDSSFWPFCDWVPAWRWGVPPGGIKATEHALTEWLVRAMSTDHPTNTDRTLFESWFETRNGLVGLKDAPEWQPSEHSEALYRLCQTLLGEKPAPWPTEALAKADAARCTYYFAYYMHQARKDEDYMAQLGPWKEMIENGLTTFAENPEPVRSDCHAWSAHPILGFFQIVAGVTSIAPGWSKAAIAPNPGSLKRFEAKIAHPAGELRVAYEDERLSIDTPVPASLTWQGKRADLPAGMHKL